MANKHSGHELSRRSFLGSSAAATVMPAPGVAADTQASPERSPFRAQSRPEKLSENLFFLEDTCNIYLIRDGRHGLLIDFGSGRILDFLSELGVSQIDWILHTHHHRDQAQGDHLAVAQRIPIAVPEHERGLFEDVEDFWVNRRVFELYDVRNDFFSLTESVPVAASLRDYETFRWLDHKLFVQPTPGHTTGSISLLTEVDGRKIAFSGDLMHSPGKVQTLYDLQLYYQEHEGVDLSIYSLAQLISAKPDFLCPSHGRPLPAPVPGMTLLSSKLKEWHQYWYKHPPTSELEPFAVSPHLAANSESTSTFYAIISDSGKALFLDYGSASWTFFQVFMRYVETRGHMRFVEHTVDKLKTRFGLKSIDVAMPSHIHDDHLNGFPHLARRYGTKIWCYENMVEILENPRGENIGCIFGEPLKIDRSFRDRETFKWEEFEFTVAHSPGHTNYQMAMFTTIDNTRVAFTGDAFFNDPTDPTSLRHNLIYRNEVKTGDHLKSIRNILEFEPQVIAPGHGKPFPIDKAIAEKFALRTMRQDELCRELIADSDTDLGIDPSWISFHPYQLTTRPGGSCSVEVRVRNHRSRAVEIKAAPILPRGWQVSQRIVEFSVAPRATGSSRLTLTVPKSWTDARTRVAIALDVIADNRYLGQIAEAVVDIAISPQGDHI